MLIIGITGGSGSGKTTLVNEVLKHFPADKIAALHADYYYKDNSHIDIQNRTSINFDHPDSIEFDLFYKDLFNLSLGQQVSAPTYDFITSTRKKETICINAAPIVIVEGILIFHDKRIRDLCHVKAFVDTEPDERLIRIIQRDMLERGRLLNEVMERYEQVKSMHVQFVEPVKRFADFIIPQGGNNKAAVDMLVALIKSGP